MLWYICQVRSLFTSYTHKPSKRTPALYQSKTHLVYDLWYEWVNTKLFFEKLFFFLHTISAKHLLVNLRYIRCWCVSGRIWCFSLSLCSPLFEQEKDKCVSALGIPTPSGALVGRRSWACLCPPRRRSPFCPSFWRSPSTVCFLGRQHRSKPSSDGAAGRLQSSSVLNHPRR